MNGLPLFDIDPIPVSRQRPGPRLVTPPFQARSETSRAGAEKAAPCFASQKARIYAHLLQCGSCGSTDQETKRALGLEINVVTARRNRLVLEGKVEDAGVRRLDAVGVAWTVCGL